MPQQGKARSGVRLNAFLDGSPRICPRNHSNWSDTSMRLVLIST